nr:hypothetical protein JVH1_6536 [Rhodococcus sp. JVH1]
MIERRPVRRHRGTERLTGVDDRIGGRRDGATEAERPLSRPSRPLFAISPERSVVSRPTTALHTHEFRSRAC